MKIGSLVTCRKTKRRGEFVRPFHGGGYLVRGERGCFVVRKTTRGNPFGGPINPELLQIVERIKKAKEVSNA